MTKKTILMALFCAGISIAAFAQEEPGTTTPPEMNFAKAPAEPPGKSLDVKFKTFREQIGWGRSGMHEKADGSVFFDAVGRSEIQAPASDRNFPASRLAAFDRAMLDAKQQMAEFVGQELSTSMSRAYEENLSSGDEFEVPAEVDGFKDENVEMIEKIKLLIHARLDKALAAEGVDVKKVEKEVLIEATKKVLLDEKFQREVSSMAQTFLCGMQAFKTFEEKGEIGVVAVWSPLLQRMAETMAYGGTVPNGVPAKKIEEQIPSSDDELLRTMGVMQMIDEKGRLTLVSFGQAGAVSNSLTAANGARQKAKLDAEARIRQFAGENVSVASDMSFVENYKEFDDMSKQYQSKSTMKTKIEAAAEKMKISGIAEIISWSAPHPDSGAIIYGAICTWSPTSSANAKALGKKLNERPQVGSGKASSSQPAKEAPGKTSSGEGMQAPIDAF